MNGNTAFHQVFTDNDSLLFMYLCVYCCNLKFMTQAHQKWAYISSNIFIHHTLYELEKFLNHEFRHVYAYHNSNELDSVHICTEHASFTVVFVNVPMYRICWALTSTSTTTATTTITDHWCYRERKLLFHAFRQSNLER